MAIRLNELAVILIIALFFVLVFPFMWYAIKGPDPGSKGG